MRVLGLETSGVETGLALLDVEGLRAQVTFPHQQQLAVRLAPAIEQLLGGVELDVTDLEGLAVCIGPGSFTGVRLGVAFAKALAYGRDIPVVGVGAFQAIAAEQVPMDDVPRCLFLPAQSGVIYAALPGEDLQEGSWTVPELAARLSSWECLTLVGPAGEAAAALGAALDGHLLRWINARPPAAATIARLGRERLCRGESDPVHALAPRYLRASTPEIRRQEAACPPS